MTTRATEPPPGATNSPDVGVSDTDVIPGPQIGSVGILRDAAVLMRARAEAATSGRWGVASVALYATRNDAQHIAGAHPTVMLAVAAWLDDVAVCWSANVEHRDPDDMPIEFEDAIDSHALRVAEAYLGCAS